MSTNDSEKNRAYQRLDAHLPVKIEGENHYDSFTENMSLGGALIFSPHRLQKGDNVKFEVRVRNQVIDLEGEIMRIAPVRKSVVKFHSVFSEESGLTYSMNQKKDEIFLFGDLNEMADFSAVESFGAGSITVNFESILRANSAGLVQLVNFINSLNAPHIKYRMVPPFLAEQMLIMPELLPLNVEVESICEIYECDACGAQKTLVFDVKRLTEDSKASIPEKIDCSCGSYLEGDILCNLKNDQLYFFAGSVLSRTLPNILPLFESIEQAKQHFESFFPYIQENQVLLDSEGKLLLFNLGIVDLFEDSSLIETLKLDSKDFFSSLNEEIKKESVEIALSLVVQQAQNIRFKSGNRNFDFDFHMLPISRLITDTEKELLGFLLTIHDNTKIQELRESLEEANNRLVKQDLRKKAMKSVDAKDIYCPNCFFVCQTITKSEDELDCPRCGSTEVFNCSLYGYGIRFGDIQAEQLDLLRDVIQSLIKELDENPSGRHNIRFVPEDLEVAFEDGNTLYRTYIKDISRGGVYVHSDSNFSIGQEVFLKLSVNEKEETLSILAKIQRKEKSKNRKEGAFGYALKFSNYNEKARENIETFINKMSDYRLLRTRQRKRFIERLANAAQRSVFVFIALIFLTAAYFVVEFTSLFPSIKTNIYGLKDQLIKDDKKMGKGTLFAQKEQKKAAVKKASTVPVKKGKFVHDPQNAIFSLQEQKDTEEFFNNPDKLLGDLKGQGLDAKFYYEFMKELSPRERKMLSSVATTPPGYKEWDQEQTKKWLSEVPLPEGDEIKKYEEAGNYDEIIAEEQYISEEKTEVVNNGGSFETVKKKNPEYEKKMNPKKWLKWEVKALGEIAVMQFELEALDEVIAKSKAEGPPNPNGLNGEGSDSKELNKLKTWQRLKEKRLKALKKKIGSRYEEMSDDLDDRPEE